jgi:tRNA U34 2-thiouridine synthase MnmA/TrmU
LPLNETIAVAMSGGVDSSTVAAMLRAEGYNLIGLTMQPAVAVRSMTSTTRGVWPKSSAFRIT